MKKVILTLALLACVTMSCSDGFDEVVPDTTDLENIKSTDGQEDPIIDEDEDEEQGS